MGSVFPYVCQSFPFTKADLGGPEGIVRLKNVKVVFSPRFFSLVYKRVRALTQSSVHLPTQHAHVHMQMLKIGLHHLHWEANLWISSSSH